MPIEDRFWRDDQTAIDPSSVDTLRRELEHLGLSSYEARILLALLRSGPANSADLARDSGVPRTSVYQVLEELGTKRLVERLPGGRAAMWACPRTDLVFDRLDAAQEERLRDHQARTARLRKVLSEPAPLAAVATAFVHAVRGAAEVRSLYDRMLTGAVSEVLVFNMPPYSTADPVRQTPYDPTGQDDINPCVLEALKRGVRFRSLYQESQWMSDQSVSFRRAMAVYHGAGVKARIVEELPTKLAVADRASVLLALPNPHQQVGFPANLYVDHPGFAALQADAFEHRWRSARSLPRDISVQPVAPSPNVS